jgi:hypothetical protein
VQDPGNVDDALQLADVRVAETGQHSARGREVCGRDEQIDVEVASVLVGAIERPSQGGALEQQGIDAGGSHGVQRIQGSSVEPGLPSDRATARDVLLQRATRVRFPRGVPRLIHRGHLASLTVQCRPSAFGR